MAAHVHKRGMKMSEKKAMYNSMSTPLTINAFRNRGCGLGIESEHYVHPTPQEVKELRKLIGFSNIELAKFTGSFFSNEKGSSTVRKWENGSGDASCITKSTWQLMLIKAGLVSISCN